LKGVLLAAGLGTRMGNLNIPKGLLKVGGREIVYRTIYYLRKFGINEFVVVVNEFSEEWYKKFFDRLGIRAVFVLNRHPERGNGYSLYLARTEVNENFVLFMSDHIYSEEFIEKALNGQGLVVDRIGKFVEEKEATKVKVNNARVEKIGKDLTDYDFFDTGFFVLTPEIFKFAEEVVKNKSEGEITLSEIIETAKVPVHEVSGEFWMDVDTQEELKRANCEVVKQSVKDSEDGIVSKYLNRKISTRISCYLVDKITPNQATLLTFLIGILSGLVAFFNVPLGGVIYQVSSAVDGIDGEIARSSLRTSKLGGYLDSVLDRFVDAFFLIALSVHLPGSVLSSVLTGLSIFGSVMVSYTTERYKGAFGESPFKSIPALKFFPGKRDERVFVIMLFCLLDKVFELFVFLAILTNLKVIYNLVLIYLKKSKEGGESGG